MLIVMGPVLDVSTLDLFRGAFIPGAILAILYLVYTLGRCWINPALGPILAEEDQPETSKNYGLEVILICMGVLAICRVFGLALSGALGLFPFGGLASTDRSSDELPIGAFQQFDESYVSCSPNRSGGPGSLGCNYS